MLGVWSALLFNVCVVLLPMAAATACFLITRDQLYSYVYTPNSARAVRARVERLSGSLIQVEFDRRSQWDDLVAMELGKNDATSARGFLLSARGMLPSREADQINANAPHGDDASIELAALNLLSGPTRARYQASVPLLSRPNAATAHRAADDIAALGAPRDFELLAAPMITGANPDPMHFVLNGFGLGLGGEFTPRMAEGAAALIEASRRDDFPPALAQQFSDLVGAAVPIERFRAEAAQRVTRNVDPSSYPVAAPAFRAALDPAKAQAAKAMLDQIGEMSDATTDSGAALLLTHARNLQDLPRLRLIALAAGDRAVAAAKELPRDGRLARAAQGALAFTKDLTFTFFIAALAGIGLAFAAFGAAFQALRNAVRRVDDDINGGSDLVNFQSFRPL